MSKAIADASVLINLAYIERFGLLPRLYDGLIVPPAVWREVVEEGDDQPGVEHANEARSEGFLTVRDPKNHDLVTSLDRSLDDGEAQAIALALEMENVVLLLDEAEARRAAAAYGISKIGVVGILLHAKKEGWIPSIGDDLKALREEAGFWLDQDLVERILAEAEEL